MERQFSGKSFRKLWTTSRGSPLFPFGTEIGKFPYHLRESFRFQALFRDFLRGFTCVLNMASLYQCSSCLFASPTMEDLVNHICLNPPFNGNEPFFFRFFFANQGYSHDLRTWNIVGMNRSGVLPPFKNL